MLRKRGFLPSFVKELDEIHQEFKRKMIQNEYKANYENSMMEEIPFLNNNQLR